MVKGAKAKKEPEAPPKDVFDPLPFESKNPATTVLMLSSSEEDVLATACEAIHKFAEKGDENMCSLINLGAVKPLITLISHTNRIVRRSAVMALGTMSSNNDVRKLMESLNVIPSVISLLSPEEDNVAHEYATLCLASLSVNFTCKVQIFEQNGLEPLVRLLSSPDPDVKKNSVECIYNLVQDYNSRVAVHKLKGISPLLALLNSEFPIIQQLALYTLENITNDGETRATLRTEQGFDKLLEFLENKEFNDLHVEALKVVANCLEDTEFTRLIQDNGGLKKLMQFVITSSSPEIHIQALRSISRAAQYSENRTILHHQDVEAALIKSLEVENDAVQSTACQVVAVMSKNDASKDSFRDLDGIKSIVQLLNSEGKEVREAAAQALSGLTNESPENAYTVYEAEGHGTLVKLLEDSCHGTVVHALDALVNIAQQEDLRNSVLACGVMKALANVLHSTHKQTLTSAALAVAAMACDAEGKAQLKDILSPLVKLLQSNDKEIRRNACWAVTVCASDRTSAIEMCKLGAMEILQDINSSLSRKNKFSEAALQKLLDNNLSAKYSLTGELFFTDVITDGFYDPGQTKVGNRVPSLDESAKQPLDQHRAVLVVNAKPENPESAEDSPRETASNKASSKPASKAKGKGRDKQKADTTPTPQALVEEKPWEMLHDAGFCGLVMEATKSVVPLPDEVEACQALAKLVCDAMGGPVEVDKEHEFFWELHLSELKVEMQCNVIPIGKIKKGTYFHRALLFKALADQIGLTCSLVRGEYNRAWNEVRVGSAAASEIPRLSLRPQTYIIDLMHKPGNLIKCSTPAAMQYQSI